MDNKLISVIVPVYNGEKTLRKCVQSIENQSYNNIEVIISDDGSADGSVQLAKQLSEEYGNIKIVQNHHGGASSARNSAIDAASGDYISFIDCDDEINSDMYCEMVCAAEDNSAELCVVGIQRRTGDMSYYQPYSDSCIKTEDNPARLYLVPMYFNSCSNKLYIADIIKKNKIYFDNGIYIGEDFLFNTQYCKYVNNTVVISKPMYIYNMSGTTIQPFSDENRFRAVAEMYNAVIPFAKSDELLRSGINEKIFDEYLLAIRLYCMSGERFFTKVRALRRVMNCREYRLVRKKVCGAGWYGRFINLKSAFLVNLYFSVRNFLK